MANTRQSTKRAKQAVKRQARNEIVKTKTKTIVKKAVDSLAAQNADQAKTAYMNAIVALAKASSKGTLPKKRAARKISRLTKMMQKKFPQALPFKTTSSK